MLWSSEFLLLHVLLTAEEPVLSGVVLGVVGDRNAFVGHTAFPIGHPVASLALLHRAAVSAWWVDALIDLAAKLGDSLVLHELVELAQLSTLTGASSCAVEHGLNRKSHSGSGVVPLDVDSVGKGTQTTLGPTGATVVGQVLVDSPGEEVGASGAAPEEVVRHVRILDGILRKRREHVTVELLVGDQSGLEFPQRPLRLAEQSEHLLEEGLLRLYDGAVGINHIGPDAVLLDPEGILASLYLEVALVGPVFTPRVSDQPVINSIHDAIAYNRDNVVNFTLIVTLEDTVAFEVLKRTSVDSTGDRTIVEHFLEDVGRVFGDKSAVVEDLVLVMVPRETATLGVTLLADVQRSAGLALLVGKGFVGGASLIGDAVLVDVLVGIQRVSSMAAVVSPFTVEKHLGRYVDFGEDGLSLDVDSVREGGGGCLGPAGPAVLGDVLVLELGKVVDSIDIAPCEA